MLIEAEKQKRQRGVSVWLVGFNPDVLSVIKRSPLGDVLGREISRAAWQRSRPTRGRKQQERLCGNNDRFSWPVPSAGCYARLSSPKPRSGKRKQVRCWLE